MKNKSLKMGLTVTTLLAIGSLASSSAMAAEPGASIKLGSLPWQEEPFTNEDVLSMIQAGFDQETIVEAIRSNEPGFDTSVEALIALKEAGVGEEIIVEILAAARAKATVSAAPDGDDDGLPSDEGVYVMKDNEYIPLAIERVEWRSGFFSTETAVGGKTTTALNARLPTLHSPLELSSTPDLLVVCKTCVFAFEYHLIRANDDDDKREFRIQFQIMKAERDTWITRGGKKDKKIEYEGEKLAPGKFKLVLKELKSGEYGFLPPTRGDHPRSLEVSMMYTFRVLGP